MGPRLISRGKPTAESRVRGLSQLASMGPRLISRGKAATAHECRVHDVRFNGAALISRGKLSHRRGEALREWRFNGAALISRGKAGVDDSGYCAGDASMGPR